MRPGALLKELFTLILVGFLAMLVWNVVPLGTSALDPQGQRFLGHATPISTPRTLFGNLGSLEGGSNLQLLAGQHGFAVGRISVGPWPSHALAW